MRRKISLFTASPIRCRSPHPPTQLTPRGHVEAIAVRMELPDQLGDVPPGTTADGNNRRRLAKELDQAAAFRCLCQAAQNGSDPRFAGRLFRCAWPG